MSVWVYVRAESKNNGDQPQPNNPNNTRETHYPSHILLNLITL